MNRINLVKHNIPNSYNEILTRVVINTTGKILNNYPSNIRRVLGGGWDDPFGFGFKLMQAKNANTIKKWENSNGKNKFSKP